MLQVRLAVRPVSWLLAFIKNHTFFFGSHGSTQKSFIKDPSYFFRPFRPRKEIPRPPSGNDDCPFRVLSFNVGWKLQFQQPQNPFFVPSNVTRFFCVKAAGPTFQGFLNVQADETSYSFHVKATKTDETSAQNQRLPHVWQKIWWVLWVVIEPQCSARCGAALSHRCQSTASGLEESVWWPVKVSTCFNIQQVTTNQSSEVHLLSCVWSLSWTSRLQRYHSKHKYIYIYIHVVINAIDIDCDTEKKRRSVQPSICWRSWRLS